MKTKIAQDLLAEIKDGFPVSIPGFQGIKPGKIPAFLDSISVEDVLFDKDSAVQTIAIDGKYYYRAADVYAAIDYNFRGFSFVSPGLRPDPAEVFTGTELLGERFVHQGNSNFLTEKAAYMILFRSLKPFAVRFAEAVAHHLASK